MSSWDQLLFVLFNSALKHLPTYRVPVCTAGGSLCLQGQVLEGLPGTTFALSLVLCSSVKPRTGTACCVPPTQKVWTADRDPCCLQGVVDGLLATTVGELVVDSPAGGETCAGGESLPCMSSFVGHWPS